jgi:SOS-response transcriptional repressor LexA
MEYLVKIDNENLIKKFENQGNKMNFQAADTKTSTKT